MYDVNTLELVNAARAGDKQALELLLARHRPMALHLAQRMVGRKEVAEELVQEALLEAYLSLSGLRMPDRFGPWLYGIVLNVCRNYRRSQQIHYLSFEAVAGGVLFDALPYSTAIPDPAQVVEAADVQGHVLQAIRSLSPKNRSAVMLFYYDQLSVQETAVVLGISVSAVKGRLHKSRLLLREQLATYMLYRPENIEEEQMNKVETLQDQVEVVVADVVLETEAPEHAGIVLLDKANRRLLSMWIGPYEAEVIAMRLLGKTTARPLTHLFLANVLNTVGIELESVRIESLRDITYYGIARLSAQGTAYEVDARPSDVIALALHMDCPIYVSADVMARAGTDIPAGYDLALQRRGLGKVDARLSQRQQAHEQTLQELRDAASERKEEQADDRTAQLLAFLFERNT